MVKLRSMLLGRPSAASSEAKESTQLAKEDGRFVNLISHSLTQIIASHVTDKCGWNITESVLRLCVPN
jgi:hypothetical protein